MKPHLLLLSFALLPSLVLARGGRGHGSGGGGGGGDGGSSSNSGDTTSNSLTNLSFREPIYTAIFAICIVFAVLTALQALQAVANARRRTNQQPPSITLPEFSVGSIFPTFLILSTICLTTAYSMQAAFYGLMYNENRPPGVSVGFYIAWYIIGFLADIFLVSGILALITHRGKVLFNASKALCDAKMVVDAILFMTLLALSMGYVGVMTVGTTGEDFQMARRLYVAYISSLFVTVVDIAVSSVILYIHSKRTPINDHKVALCLTFIISPLFVLYALCLIVLQALRNSNIVVATTRPQLDLPRLVIGCVTQFIIIATCLKFGMPFIPKQKGTEEHTHKHKGSYA